MNLNKTDLLEKILIGLRDECNLYCDSINTIKDRVSVDKKDYFDDLINNLDQLVFLINKHISYNECELVDIHFSDILNTFFTSTVRNKWHKHIVYRYQNGLFGEETPLTDQEKLYDVFTFHDCLPIMGVVPIQLADNAIKYMPTGGSLLVKMIQTEKRKTIELSNIGPSLSKEDLDEKIWKPGMRGDNAEQKHFGMGMGLYEIEQIVNMHWWLEPNMVVSSEACEIEAPLPSLGKADFSYNGIPYNRFTIRIQLANIAQSGFEKQQIKKWQETYLPEIIVHDLKQIKPKLISQVRNIEHNITTVDKDISWREYCHRLRVYIDIVDELLSIATLAVFGENETTIDSIVGDECVVDFDKMMKIKMKNLIQFFYPSIIIDFEGNLSGHKNSTLTGAYILCGGIINTVLSNCNKAGTISVEFANTGQYDVISIYSHEIDFTKLFNKLYAEKTGDALLWNKLHLYEILSKYCDIEIKIEKHKLDIII